MDNFHCTFLSWEEISRLSSILSSQIDFSDLRPDFVVALARGGLVPARLLCDHLHLKNLTSVKVDHWGITASPDGQAKLSYGTSAELTGKKVLIVDDIADTGQSLSLAKQYVESKGPVEVKTATLIKLSNSSFTPDFFAEEKEWAWFIFPWNIQEDLVNLVGKLTGEGRLYLTPDRLVASFKDCFSLDVTREQVESALERGRRLRLWPVGNTNGGKRETAPSPNKPVESEGSKPVVISSILTGRQERAEIAVVGGSGFYTLFGNTREVLVETPYGSPSANITLGDIAGKKVAFLPRHGKNHKFPPHKINYRANLYALKALGVNHILAVTACGSLQQTLPPGEMVVLSQLVDRTSGRISTFYDGPITTHVSTADPYCPQLSQLLYETGRNMGFSIRSEGTVVVIQGPRFSTRAESKWYTKMGWQVINMTQFPEAVLARELEMCYAALAIVTDYDAGIKGCDEVTPVSFEEVGRVFSANLEKAKKLVQGAIEKIDIGADCGCQRALAGARV